MKNQLTEKPNLFVHRWWGELGEICVRDVF